MIDLDHFKSINDEYGHVYGDYVLKEVAKILKSSIRESDFVGRYGGEEFIVFLPETNIKSAEIVAEKLRQSVEDYNFEKIKSKITISCGVGEISIKYKTIESFIEEIDKKLYMAKEQGRNKVMS